MLCHGQVTRCIIVKGVFMDRSPGALSWTGHQVLCHGQVTRCIIVKGVVMDRSPGALSWTGHQVHHS